MTRIFIAVGLMLSLLLWVGCGDRSNPGNGRTLGNNLMPGDNSGKCDWIGCEEELRNTTDTNSSGQDSRLIYSMEVSNADEKVKGIHQKSAVYVWVDFVKIDLEKITNQGPFTLQFGEKNILVNKERVDSRSSGSYTFVGSNNNGDRVLLSVLGNDIQGVIETTTGVFSVMTIGENEYAIVKMDYSKFKED